MDGPDERFASVEHGLRKIMASELREVRRRVRTFRADLAAVIESVDVVCREELGITAEVLLGAWDPTPRGLLDDMRPIAAMTAIDPEQVDGWREMLSSLWMNVYGTLRSI